MTAFSKPVSKSPVTTTNGRTFVPADLFGNPTALVTKDGTEIPVYADKGAAFYLKQQNDPKALALLSAIQNKQDAGEDVVLTLKVVFRGHKAEVVADTSVSLEDLI